MQQQEDQNSRRQGGEEPRANATKQDVGSPAEDQKMAQNPNPRANENTDGTPIDKGSDSGVGSEITDGEAG